MEEKELSRICNKSTNECIELSKKIKEKEAIIDKALELLDSYKLGKYDFALTPAGLLELEDILRGKDEERNNRNTIKKSNL